jgi:hypothetical protein
MVFVLILILIISLNIPWTDENYAQAHSSLIPLVSSSPPLEKIKVEKEEFIHLYFGIESTLAAQHPLNQRLEKWSHKIHSILKLKYPVELRDVPPAEIVISPAVSTKDSAFVTTLNRCFKNSILFEAKDQEANSVLTEASYLEISQGEFVERKSLSQCVPYNDYDQRTEEVRAYLSSLLVNCQVLFESGMFKVRGNCPEQRLFSGRKFSGFSIAGTVNMVSISSQMLSVIDKEFKAGPCSP